MRLLLGMLLLSWPLAAGCEGDSDDGDGDSSGDSDSDSDSDSDGDSDADTDSDGDPLDCDGGRYDAATGLCWQAPAEDGKYPWEDAIGYCEGLNLAGHGDWYLPSIDQFKVLLGGCSGDYCDSCSESVTCYDLFGDLVSDYFTSQTYWSSTEEDSEFAWGVDLHEGELSDYDIEVELRARCVRDQG